MPFAGVPSHLCIPRITPKLFRRFRKKPHQPVEVQDFGLHFKITNLQSQNIRYQHELEDAQEEITELKKQLAEYDCLLCHAQSRLTNLAPLPPFEVDETPPQRTSMVPVSPKSDPRPVWIDDIWLCTERSDGSLRTAERHWQHQSPLLALEVVLKAIEADPFLSQIEKVRCHLFAAAVLYTLERYHESMQRLEKIFHMLDETELTHAPHVKRLMGIAYFIQGRNLIDAGKLEAAYMSLSRAQGTHGYYHMVRKYHGVVIVEFTRLVADDSAAVSSSLLPCLSSRPNESVTSLAKLTQTGVLSSGGSHGGLCGGGLPND